jgi:hypothetical protein
VAYDTCAGETTFDFQQDKFMSTKEIEAWKANIAKGKNVFVTNNVVAIHPVVDRMVRHLLEIDLIQFLRVTQADLHASNEITIKGRTKIPVSTPGHPTAVGVHLILDIPYNTVQFFEITSAEKGYGERMVQAVLKSISDNWEAAVAMDYSEGFWERMVKKYRNIVIL